MSAFSGFTYRLQETSYNRTVYNLICLLQVKIAAGFRGEKFDDITFEKYFTTFYFKLTRMEKLKHHPPIFSYSLKDLASFFGLSETQPPDHLSNASSTSHVSLSKFNTISQPTNSNTIIFPVGPATTALNSVVNTKSKEGYSKKNLLSTQIYSKNQVRSFSQKSQPKQVLPKAESPLCHEEYGNQVHRIHKPPEKRHQTVSFQNSRSISPKNFYHQKKSILSSIFSTSFKRKPNGRFQFRNIHINRTSPDSPCSRPML